MKRTEKSNDVIRYISIGIQWSIMLLLAIWGGLKIDKKTGWKFPVFTVLLPLLALLFSLWKIIQEFSKPKK